MSGACVFCARVKDHSYRLTGVAGVVRFEPLNPVTPGHMLFIPQVHVYNAALGAREAGLAVQAAAMWGRLFDQDFNLITSTGVSATQTIEHLHVHYVPRHDGDGLHLPWTGQVKTP